MMRKTCRVCGRSLTLDKLVTDSHASMGVKNICKACYRDERKSYPSYPRRRDDGR